MSKDFVGMGYQLCPICYEKHDEVVLMQTRLHTPRLSRDNFMGFSLCPKHKAMAEEYIALVAVSNPNVGSNLKPEDARPTGEIAHIKREAAKHIFNTPMHGDVAFVYTEPAVIAKLKEMVA